MAMKKRPGSFLADFQYGQQRPRFFNRGRDETSVIADQRFLLLLEMTDRLAIALHRDGLGSPQGPQGGHETPR
jgi:hypothetical protein